MKLRIPLNNFDRERTGVLELSNARILPGNELKDPRLDGKTKYVLEMEEVQQEKPRRSLDRVLSIFKLFKDCLVLSNVVLIGEKRADHLSHYTHWVDQDRGVPAYFLTQQEEEDFSRFWEEFSEIDAGNFAVSRFHLADYRAYSTDRFVDYVESLEYLFVPDSGEAEISYKFRHRGCLILGRDRPEKNRREIFGVLRDAYRLRSAVVHGGNINKYLKGHKWEDKLNPVRSYAREAIKFFFRQKCIDNAKRRKELLEDLLIFNAKIDVCSTS